MDDGEMQGLEYQAGDLVWIRDVTLGCEVGKKIRFHWPGQMLIKKVFDRWQVVV